MYYAAIHRLMQHYSIVTYLRVHGSASNSAMFGCVINQALNLMHLLHLCAHTRRCGHISTIMLEFEILLSF